MDYFYYLWLLSYIATTVTLITLFVMLVSKCFAKPASIEGKHVLVTGGSSGIGRSVAIEAAKLGANVSIIARDSVRLQLAVNDIQKACVKQSQKVKFVSLDISRNYEHVEKTLNDLEEEMGEVYMLINCAGTAICGTLEDMSIDSIHHLINLNYLGTVHTIKSLITKMKSRGEGHIVVTASQAAMLGIYGLSIYSGTKFALRGLAESLYMEVKPYGISVTLALPPDTDTPGFANEEKSKPLETKLISETGGLYSPDVVGAKLLKDALGKKFFSTVGLESYFVTSVCSGMSPASSFLELLFQGCVMGILRLASFYYQKLFLRIIEQCKETPTEKKKKRS